MAAAEIDHAESFEHGLRKALEANPKQGRRAKRILDILNSKPSRRRSRILARMEAHATAHVQGDVKAVGAIDWSKFDFKGFLEGLINLLLKILPLILL